MSKIINANQVGEHASLTIHQEKFNATCKRLHKQLRSRGESQPLSLSETQEALAKAFGFRNLHGLQQFFEGAGRPSAAAPAANRLFGVGGYDEAGLLIGIVGYAESGKDVVADVLARHHEFKRLAFADKIKEVISGVYDVPLATFRDRNLKDLPHANLCNNYLQRKYAPDALRAIACDILTDLDLFVVNQKHEAYILETCVDIFRRALNDDETSSPSRAVQLIGAEGFCKRLDAKVWVNYVMRQAREFTIAGQAVVISDACTPDEFDAIRLKGGLMLGIERGAARHHERKLEHHIEKLLTRCDSIICSDGDIDKLEAAAHKFHEDMPFHLLVGLKVLRHTKRRAADRIFSIHDLNHEGLSTLLASSLPGDDMWSDRSKSLASLIVRVAFATIESPGLDDLREISKVENLLNIFNNLRAESAPGSDVIRSMEGYFESLPGILRKGNDFSLQRAAIDQHGYLLPPLRFALDLLAQAEKSPILLFKADWMRGAKKIKNIHQWIFACRDEAKSSPFSAGIGKISAEIHLPDSASSQEGRLDSVLSNSWLVDPIFNDALRLLGEDQCPDGNVYLSDLLHAIIRMFNAEKRERFLLYLLTLPQQSGQISERVQCIDEILSWPDNTNP